MKNFLFFKGIRFIAIYLCICIIFINSYEVKTYAMIPSMDLNPSTASTFSIEKSNPQFVYGEVSLIRSNLINITFDQEVMIIKNSNRNTGFNVEGIASGAIVIDAKINLNNRSVVTLILDNNIVCSDEVIVSYTPNEELIILQQNRHNLQQCDQINKLIKPLESFTGKVINKRN